MKAYQTTIKTVRRIGIGANMKLETDESKSVKFFGDHVAAQDWVKALCPKHIITHEYGEEQYIGEFINDETMSLLSGERVDTQYWGNIIPIDIS